jgi:predicted PurR-regulated permease PerM
MSREERTPTDEFEPAPRRALKVPPSTIVTILLTAAALWAIYTLRAVIALVLVAVVLAVAFDPVVGWLERRRVPRWAGATLIVFTTMALLVLFVVICGSSLVTQVHQVGDRVRAIQEEAAAWLPEPVLRRIRESGGGSADVSLVGRYAVSLSAALVSAVLGMVIAFILTIYLLTEGRRTWNWLVAYVPRRNRGRVRETALAACEAMRHYVAGNVLTSLFAGVSVFISMRLLHVPAALLLAVLAGICDFVPVLGFIVSALPALLLATTVSLATTLIVAGVYVAYHLAENYWIGPRVYGGQLRLSNLAVLLSFAIGAELFGVIGALLALPVAAMYPCVEDIWLREYLGEDAVDTHRRIEQRPT